MRKIQIGLVVLLASFLVLEAILSLNWPITHDEAPLFYESFLMRAEGRQPYRDLYDFQMPGVYAIFFGIGLFHSCFGRHAHCQESSSRWAAERDTS